MPFSKAKWTAVTGYACAAAGTILFTQLNRIANFRMGHNVLDAAMVGSMSATFGGFATAAVASAIWARRSPTREPLKIAAYIAVGSVLLTLLVGINIHGPSAILMFLVVFSVINVVTLLVAGSW